MKKNKIIGSKHWLWKGEDVKYTTIHNWITYHKGKPKKCERCGKIRTKPRQIHWANVDHKYSKNLDDYIALCSPCHGKHDVEHKIRKYHKTI